jgi:hypothetical protein
MRASEVFGVEDAVALCEHFVALLSQIELFAEVAHVEQFLRMLLKEAE